MDKERLSKKFTGFTGISKRWFINTLLPIALLLIALDALVLVIFYGSIYNSVQQQLSVRSNLTVEFFDKYVTKKLPQFYYNSKKFMEEFPDNQSIEIQLINSNGVPIYSSSGFAKSFNIITPDFTAALKTNEGIYVGTDANTNEKIMSVSKMIFDDRNSPVAVVRFVTSLARVNGFFMNIVIIVIFISFMILLFVIISGQYFLRTIAGPVREISVIAKEIASGERDSRIEKRYNDEVGDLADTINNMAQELDKTEKLKNDFISSVSHELRTPLTAIKGWSDTIKEDSSQDRATLVKGVTIISKETERLTKMVEELLDFSRIELERFTLNMEKVEILSEFEETVFMYMEKAKAQNVVLTYKMNDNIPNIMADKYRIKQVFINILDNSLKHTPSGGRIIAGMMSDEERVAAIIHDNGEGISEEDLKHIKEKFYKGSSSKRGSGIGLAICDEIIRLHGGSLEIESELGVGTTVTIILPRTNN